MTHRRECSAHTMCNLRAAANCKKTHSTWKVAARGEEESASVPKIDYIHQVECIQTFNLKQLAQKQTAVLNPFAHPARALSLSLYGYVKYKAAALFHRTMEFQLLYVHIFFLPLITVHLR